MQKQIKLTRQQKRILIAKDVLKKIENNEILFARGRYWDSSLEDYLLDTYEDRVDRINIKSCRVCALSGMLLSHIDKFNKCEVVDLIGNDANYVRSDNIIYVRSDNIIKVLSRNFTLKQLYLIECVFELGGGGFSYNLPNKLILASQNYGKQYAEDKNRVLAIMRNIIRNKGEFIIPKKYFK